MARGKRNPAAPVVQATESAPAAGVQAAALDEAAGKSPEDPAHAEFAVGGVSQPGALAEGFKEPGPAVKRIKTIPMIRTEDGKPADVHPDEVEHMKQHGWEVKE
jgi:hypothetical protein